jgi:hypothetical protein
VSDEALRFVQDFVLSMVEGRSNLAYIISYEIASVALLPRNDVKSVFNRTL